MRCLGPQEHRLPGGEATAERKKNDKNKKSQSAINSDVEFAVLGEIDGNAIRFDKRAMGCVIDGMRFEGFTKNTWIGDTGASCHLTNSMEGMFNVEDIQEQIEGSSGSITATVRGKKKCVVRQEVDGTEITTVLSPVKYCKDATVNLFSITSAMQKDADN